jgi:hypothetical protein
MALRSRVRWCACAGVLLGVATACGSDSTSSGSTNTGSSAATGGGSGTSSTGGGAASAGSSGSLSIAVSGAVTGQLTIAPGSRVGCNPAAAGYMDVAATINGQVYAVRIAVPKGTTSISTTSPNTVSVAFTDPSQKVWAGGRNVAASGTVTINADGSGSIDTDLAPLQNPGGSLVHLKGTWTCAR